MAITSFKSEQRKALRAVKRPNNSRIRTKPLFVSLKDNSRLLPKLLDRFVIEAQDVIGYIWLMYTNCL